MAENMLYSDGVYQLNFLVDPDFRTGFITGAILHVILVVTRISLLLFECYSPGCSEIVIWDFPVSIVYYAFDSDFPIIFFSLLLGSALWGFWGFGLLKLVRLLTRKFS